MSQHLESQRGPLSAPPSFGEGGRGRASFIVRVVCYAACFPFLKNFPKNRVPRRKGGELLDAQDAAEPEGESEAEDARCGQYADSLDYGAERNEGERAGEPIGDEVGDDRPCKARDACLRDHRDQASVAVAAHFAADDEGTDDEHHHVEAEVGEGYARQAERVGLAQAPVRDDLDQADGEVDERELHEASQRGEDAVHVHVAGIERQAEDPE